MSVVCQILEPGTGVIIRVGSYVIHSLDEKDKTVDQLMYSVYV